ncbi:hypothetical protein C8R43DRAFT_953584 [Mycena crocata]|nr:hypothetical protein C8R43DRAFT_953584 [Mycena crocata]
MSQVLAILDRGSLAPKKTFRVMKSPTRAGASVEQLFVTMSALTEFLVPLRHQRRNRPPGFLENEEQALITTLHSSVPYESRKVQNSYLTAAIKICFYYPQDKVFPKEKIRPEISVGKRNMLSFSYGNFRPDLFLWKNLLFPPDNLQEKVSSFLNFFLWEDHILIAAVPARCVVNTNFRSAMVGIAQGGSMYYMLVGTFHSDQSYPDRFIPILDRENGTCTQTSWPDKCQYREKVSGKQKPSKQPDSAHYLPSDSTSTASSSSSRSTAPPHVMFLESAALTLPDEYIDLELLPWPELIISMMCYAAHSRSCDYFPNVQPTFLDSVSFPSCDLFLEDNSSSQYTSEPLLSDPLQIVTKFVTCARDCFTLVCSARLRKASRDWSQKNANCAAKFRIWVHFVSREIQSAQLGMDVSFANLDSAGVSIGAIVDARDEESVPGDTVEPPGRTDVDPGSTVVCQPAGKRRPGRPKGSLDKNKTPKPGTDEQPKTRGRPRGTGPRRLEKARAASAGAIPVAIPANFEFETRRPVG